MTNTDFIADLELVEGALYDLKKISQLDVDITNFVTLIHDRSNMALPDVTQMLVMHDIMDAHKKGLINWSEDVEAILKREVSIEEAIAQREALSSN